MVGALVMSVLAACGTGGSAEPPREVPGSATRTVSTTSSSVALPSSEQAGNAALVAYRGMWADFVEAGRTSDWQSAKLGRHATGLALTNLSRGLYADRYNGLVTKGEPVLNPTVSSVEPATEPKKVIVSDCGDSTNWLKYRADTGELADKVPGGRRAINAIAEKQSDGSWKISDYGVHDVGTC